MTTLEEIFQDPQITEILFNSPDQIWCEKQGLLQRLPIEFKNKLEYKNYIESLLHETHGSLNQDQPFHEAKYRNFRLSLVDESITHTYAQAAFRRQSVEDLDLSQLCQQGWCTESQKEILMQMMDKKENFLIVGNTGSGKTTLANALLKLASSAERIVVIEDTDEICLSNGASTKLLTRKSLNEKFPSIDQSLLLKQALRLRPDRLVVGEIRFTEAKDFLLCLSTGHGGSFGTLHALHPHQALLRLEMLIQMGSPQWSLQAIRQLIQISLNKLIVVERNAQGQRLLKGIYHITSLEENGFLIEKL